MTTIKASCPVCGEQELTPGDIRLMVCRNAPSSYYEFGCPSCGDDVRKPADDYVISLLMSGGVVAHTWELAPRPAGPPLTEDDLIAFGLAIETCDDLVVRAAEAVAGYHR